MASIVSCNAALHTKRVHLLPPCMLVHAAAVCVLHMRLLSVIIPAFSRLDMVRSLRVMLSAFNCAQATAVITSWPGTPLLSWFAYSIQAVEVLLGVSLVVTTCQID